MTKPFLLAIIPARGGSKGVPRKNIRFIAGKPLIGWTIDAAKAARDIAAIVVSTDDAEIGSVARDFGLECENLRPAELSGDTAKTIDVMRYEIERFETSKNIKVTDVILLQPTTPLRQTSDIDKAYKTYRDSGLTSLISVCDASATHPAVMYRRESDHLVSYLGDNSPVRRQDMEPVFTRNGAIYITARDTLMNGNLIIADHTAFYEMPRQDSANIDEIFDFEFAEWLLSRRPHVDPQS